MDKTKPVIKRKSKSPEDTMEVKRRVVAKPAVKKLVDEEQSPVKTKIMRDPATGVWRREAVTETKKPGEYELVLSHTFFSNVVYSVWFILPSSLLVLVAVTIVCCYERS